MNANVTPPQPRRAAMRDARPLHRVHVRLLNGEEIEFTGHACQFEEPRTNSAARHQLPGMFAMFWRAWRRW